MVSPHSYHRGLLCRIRKCWKSVIHSHHPTPFLFFALRVQAHLTQLIQQQYPQPQIGLVRPSWEAGQLVGTAGDTLHAPADSGLLGALRELQTPHASMHSPHSLRARGSSHGASPVVQTEDLGAAPRCRKPPVGDEDARPRGQQKGAPASGRRNRSPIRPGNQRATREPPVSSARGGVPPASLTSPNSRYTNNGSMEPGNNKRTREPEETALKSGWRRALPSATRHAELDMDAEAGWQSAEPTTRGDPMKVYH